MYVSYYTYFARHNVENNRLDFGAASAQKQSVLKHDWFKPSQYHQVQVHTYVHVDN